MIEPMIGIYLLTWGGVVMILMPQRSFIRVWAFLPAAVCALGIPMAVWDFVRNAELAMALLVSGGLLPFGLLAALLVRRWSRRDKNLNQTSVATSEPAPGAAFSSPQGGVGCRYYEFRR